MKDNFEERIKNSKNIRQLTNVFNDVNKALDKTCDHMFKKIFDYKFSNFLNYQYIQLNKTKSEIADLLGISESTVYYYIKKYSLQKSKENIKRKIIESTKITCQEKYGVNHPGELSEAHQKRIENILNKTNGNYSKLYYPKLKKSDETKYKMSISQQYRREMEKLGD